jgi:cardiolipin synthase A/B
VVLLYDRGACERLAEEQARYVREGEILTLESWQRRPPPLKAIENLARMLSPLL